MLKLVEIDSAVPEENLVKNVQKFTIETQRTI